MSECASVLIEQSVLLAGRQSILNAGSRFFTRYFFIFMYVHGSLFQRFPNADGSQVGRFTQLWNWKS